jgi:hypothetical protein
MKFSAPKQITWIIALILGVVGILANRNVSTTLRQLGLDFSVRTCVAGDA